MNSSETALLLAEFSSVVRIQTLKRLEQVPEGFINWRLNNTAMSFADIVQHLIDVDEFLFKQLKSKELIFQWEVGTQRPHSIIDRPIMGKLLQRLRHLQTERHDLISGLSRIKLEEQLADKKGRGITLSWFIMRQVLEHEIYHRGQIAAYLKVLKGESE